MSDVDAMSYKIVRETHVKGATSLAEAERMRVAMDAALKVGVRFEKARWRKAIGALVSMVEDEQ